MNFSSHRSLRSKRSCTRQTWAARRRFSHSTFFSFHFSRSLNAKYSARPTFVQERLLSQLIAAREFPHGSGGKKWRLHRKISLTRRSRHLHRLKKVIKMCFKPRHSKETSTHENLKQTRKSWACRPHVFYTINILLTASWWKYLQGLL